MQKDFEEIFPQLNESEDERIRKYLVEELKAAKSVGELKFTIPQPTREECIAYLEKQKEQKSNIELIQRSWYMEGYHDGKFGKEPMWLITTGEEGPKYELNPKYGKKLVEEQKPVTNDGQQECPYKDLALVKNFFGEYKRKCKLSNKACDSKECKQWNELQAEFRNINEAFEDGKKEVVAHPEKYGLQKPAEWSEEDEAMWMDIKYQMIHGSYIPFDKIEWIENRLKSLRPQPHWKPSEDEERLINTAISFLKDFADKGYENAVECIDWLKSKMNGNPCK
jgi:hypothetical protein